MNSTPGLASRRAQRAPLKEVIRGGAGWIPSCQDGAKALQEK